MDLKLYISPKIAKKLKDKHGVDTTEVHEIWDAYNGITLEDTRAQHRTNPATQWFVARTSAGRLLKVMYIPRDDIGFAFLRSCYDANKKVISIFQRKGGTI